MMISENFPDINVTPVLFEGRLDDYLSGRSLSQASDGETAIVSAKGKLREGIVIKPMIEEWTESVGRLIIKQRSPVYLGKTDF